MLNCLFQFMRKRFAGIAQYKLFVVFQHNSINNIGFCSFRTFKQFQSHSRMNTLPDILLKPIVGSERAQIQVGITANLEMRNIPFKATGFRTSFALIVIPCNVDLFILLGYLGSFYLFLWPCQCNITYLMFQKVFCIGICHCLNHIVNDNHRVKFLALCPMNVTDRNRVLGPRSGFIQHWLLGISQEAFQQICDLISLPRFTTLC